MSTSYYKLYKTEVDNDYFWIKNESSLPTEIELYIIGDSSVYYNENVISCSKDKVNWENTRNTLGIRIELEPFQKLFLRSSGGFSKGENSYIMIIGSSIFSMGGPIASLIDYTNMENVTSVPDWCFNNLCSRWTTFSDSLQQKNLIDISQIDFGNITTIGEGSFYQAFYVTDYFGGFSYIKTLPDFSKITTIGRRGMYKMFQGTPTLTGKVDMSNLTSIEEEGLYGAFGYTKLTEAPDFSSLTTIGNGGLKFAFKYDYHMKGQPLMSNVTTIGNYGMDGCFSCNENLTKGADLSSCTQIGSYALQQCYHQCFRLEEVTAPNIDSWYSYFFDSWLYRAGEFVTGTKTFNAPTGLEILTDTSSGIPSGWTRVDY